MVTLIAGATHTGKTWLAQRLLEQFHVSYLSLDHLKMGLIRSGLCPLSPESDDEELTGFLWPVTREIIKTAIENQQDLVIEGCYIPFSWQQDFSAQYLSQIQAIWLIFSESYIQSHFQQIKGYANIVEHRLDDSDCVEEILLKENRRILAQCRLHGQPFHLIDGIYHVSSDLFPTPPGSHRTVLL